MDTASCAVGATIRPGNQVSLPFFFSLTSTQTIFPMLGSRSSGFFVEPHFSSRPDSESSSPSSSLLSSLQFENNQTIGYYAAQLGSASYGPTFSSLLVFHQAQVYQNALDVLTAAGQESHSLQNVYHF